jgi:hypothetical protein
VSDVTAEEVRAEMERAEAVTSIVKWSGHDRAEILRPLRDSIATALAVRAREARREALKEAVVACAGGCACGAAIGCRAIRALMGPET